MNTDAKLLSPERLAEIEQAFFEAAKWGDASTTLHNGLVALGAELCEGVSALSTLLKSVEGKRDEARAWISDLQSGMYINCVYCGHRYGPGDTTPVSAADALKAHVEQCPKHPMSALKSKLTAAEHRASVAEAGFMSTWDFFNGNTPTGDRGFNREFLAAQEAVVKAYTALNTDITGFGSTRLWCC